MRIGIVGTNFVSDMFMKGAEAVPEIQASAVISGHREHAEAFAGKYGIPHVYGNLEELLDSGEIDAVYLAVPNSLHKEMALQVLKRGIPLICEKPLVPTLADAKELYACAEAHHAYLHDAIVPLYTDHFQILKDRSIPAAMMPILPGRIRPPSGMISAMDAGWTSVSIPLRIWSAFSESRNLSMPAR